MKRKLREPPLPRRFALAKIELYPFGTHASALQTQKDKAKATEPGPHLLLFGNSAADFLRVSCMDGVASQCLKMTYGMTEKVFP